MNKAKSQVIPLVSNIEAEQAVIACIMVKSAVLSEVKPILSPQDFSQGRHCEIYQAILDLDACQAPIDLVTVTSLLKEKGRLEKVGGPVFLMGLADNIGSTANVAYYARLVHERAVVRFLHQKTLEIAQACQPGTPTEEILQFAESSIFEAIDRYSQDYTLIISEKVLLKKDFSREESLIANGILPKGGGMILAGESGEGKSLLRLELAIHLALGWDCWGLDIPKPRKVLTLQFENTEAIEQYRLKKMLAGLNVKDCGDNLLFPTPKIRVDISEKKDQEKIVKLIEKNQVDIVIYDPLTSLHRFNENDNVQMRAVLDTITEINDSTGAAAMVLHHYGKPGADSSTAHRTRGASSIRDWTDTLIGVSRKKGEAILRNLDFVKVRNGPEPKSIVLERDKETFLHRVSSDDDLCTPEKVRDLLEDMGGRVEGQEALKLRIMEEMNCGEVRARHFIQQAISREAILSSCHPSDNRKKVYFTKNRDSDNRDGS